MTWRLLFALIGLSIAGLSPPFPRVCLGQGPPGAEGLDSARPSPTDAGFFGGSGVVRFQLIQGRLSLDAPRHRKGSQNFSDDDTYESITVTADRGLPSLHYVCQTPAQHVTLDVTDADTVRIESWLPVSGQRSILSHGDDGDVTWTIQSDGKTQHHTATSLLHVRVLAAETFDRHHDTLFARMLRGVSMSSLAGQVREAMIVETQRSGLRVSGAISGAIAGNHSGFSDAGVRDCVESLGSPDRRTRAIAEATLLSWGSPVLASLPATDSPDLDAEQVERIRMIRRRLRPRAGDTPQTLAKWLVNDAAYWSHIADDLDAADREAAKSHLARFAIN